MNSLITNTKLWCKWYFNKNGIIFKLQYHNKEGKLNIWYNIKLNFNMKWLFCFLEGVISVGLNAARADSIGVVW